MTTSRKDKHRKYYPAVVVCPGGDYEMVSEREAEPVALQREKIPYEAHIFPFGGHGLSVCTEEVGADDAYNARWMDMSIE